MNIVNLDAFPLAIMSLMRARKSLVRDFSFRLWTLREMITVRLLVLKTSPHKHPLAVMQLSRSVITFVVGLGT